MRGTKSFWSKAAALLFVAASAFTIPGVANAMIDAVLYEVTESVRMDGATSSFRSSNSTLSGFVASGSVICPADLYPAGCSVTVYATGKASDDTGIGPVTGRFEVLVQDANSADAPEIVVLAGTINGTMDMSPAFLKNQPYGSISGRFSSSGKWGTAMDKKIVNGLFTGTFRIPFVYNGAASYLLDDGSVERVQAAERALGQPTVRLELKLSK
jgi:hypothetical protein